MAVTVVTAVVFSSTLIDAAAPPPSLLISGALSLAAVMLTEMPWVLVRPAPSATWTVTA